MYCCNSNVVNQYQITMKQSGTVLLKGVFLENPAYARRCPSTILTFLQNFLKLAFLYLSLYHERRFTSKKFFFFFQVIIACHLSKELSSIRKESVVLFGPKLSIFLFQTYLQISFRNLVVPFKQLLPNFKHLKRKLSIL